MNTDFRFALLSLAFLLTGTLLLGCDSGPGTEPTAFEGARPFEMVWSIERPYEPGSYSRTQPAIDGDRAFVAPDSLLRAVELRTGRVLWRTPLESHLSGLKLLQDDSTIYLNDAYRVMAVRKQDGTPRWTANLRPLKESYAAGPKMPMVQDVTYLYLARHNGVLRIEKATGAVDVLAALPLPETDTLSYRDDINNLYPPVLTEDGLLYVPSSYIARFDNPVDPRDPHYGFVYCLDAQSGAVRWRYSVPQRYIEEEEAYIWSNVTGVAVSGDRLVFAAGGSVVALNRFSGEPLWETFFGNEDQFGLGRNVAADAERAYATSWGGYVRAFDLQNGEVLWEQYAIASIATWPVLHGGLVYQLNDGGSGLWVFDAATGEVLLRHGQPSTTDSYSLYRSRPAVGGGMIVIGGTQGVYGLRAPEPQE